MAWEHITGKISHATRQGTLVHSRPSSMCHCGLILDLKSGTDAREMIATRKKEKKKSASGECFVELSPIILSYGGEKKKEKKKRTAYPRLYDLIHRKV